METAKKSKEATSREFKLSFCGTSVAVSTDRWFIRTGLVLTPGVQGPGRK